MSSADTYIGSLAPLGWSFGLERIRRLTDLLGMPQRRFASVHVVGTNGKTSVARMTAALLAAEGMKTGAYVSPHIGSWRERILIDGEPIPAEAFDEAIGRAREAAEVADRSAGDDGPISQFELVTGAAFHALATAKVEFAAIEAGLGGRLDATNILPSRATILTSIGLDHTEWLGETLEQIAAEKLAVLREHSALVIGDLPARIRVLAEAAAAERHAKLVEASSAPQELAELVPRGYYRRNLDLALASAAEVLGRPPAADPSERLRDRLLVAGRLELVGTDPLTILDAAHNPDGAVALAAALGGLIDAPRVVACLAVLSDKDAAGIAEALAPLCSVVVTTEIPDDAIASSGRPRGSSTPAEELARSFRQAGSAQVHPAPLMDDALQLALRLARERGEPLLVCGSHHLLERAGSLSTR